jgi:hypothetical protein
MNPILQGDTQTLFKLDISQNEFDICVCVIGIELRLIGNIEELMFKQFLLQLSEPKADAADCGCIVGYCKLQMFAP